MFTGDPGFVFVLHPFLGGSFTPLFSIYGRLAARGLPRRGTAAVPCIGTTKSAKMAMTAVGDGSRRRMHAAPHSGRIGNDGRYSRFARAPDGRVQDAGVRTFVHTPGLSPSAPGTEGRSSPALAGLSRMPPARFERATLGLEVSRASAG
jgi:hypothetical protein